MKTDAATARKWTDAGPELQAEFGVRYRTSIPCQAWARRLFKADDIRAALKPGKVVAGGRVRIVALDFFEPGKVPAEWVSRGVKRTDWGVRVEWEKVSAGTQVIVLAAAIVAVIVAATLAWVVVTKWTEKETIALGDAFAEDFHSVSQDLKDLGTSTVFSPGVIIAAVVAVALIFRRR